MKVIGIIILLAIIFAAGVDVGYDLGKNRKEDRNE